MSEKGIVGRGVLVDYFSWLINKGRTIDHFDTTPIPVSELQACLADQGTEVHFGDILLVRTGIAPTYRFLVLVL